MQTDFEKFDHENVAADMRQKAYKKRLEENPRVKVLKKRFPVFPIELVARLADNELEELDRLEAQRKDAINSVVEHNIKILQELGYPLKHPLEDIQKATQRVCDFFKILPDFFLSTNLKTRTFLLLEFIDQMLSSKKSKETAVGVKKRAFDRIKVILTDPGITWSGRISEQADANKRRGYEFFPTHEHQSQHAKNIDENKSYAVRYHDKQATEKLKRELSFENPNNILRSIRVKLGIVKQSDEKPFEIVILSKTAKEITQDRGREAFIIKDVIYLPRDYSPHTIKHEYIHRQRPPLAFGVSSILGRGLTEARVESLTEKPDTYKEQRAVLRRLLKTAPTLLPLVEAYEYEPSNQKLDAVFLEIMKTFGTKGLSAILLMSSRATNVQKEADKKNFYHGDFIFISPTKTDTVLSKIKRKKRSEGNSSIQGLSIEDDKQVQTIIKRIESLLK